MILQPVARPRQRVRPTSYLPSASCFSSGTSQGEGLINDWMLETMLQCCSVARLVQVCTESLKKVLPRFRDWRDEMFRHNALLAIAAELFSRSIRHLGKNLFEGFCNASLGLSCGWAILKGIIGFQVSSSPQCTFSERLSSDILALKHVSRIFGHCNNPSTAFLSGLWVWHLLLFSAQILA